MAAPTSLRPSSGRLPRSLTAALDARAVSVRAFYDTQPIVGGCQWLTAPDTTGTVARDEVAWTDSDGVDHHRYVCRSHLLNLVDHALAGGVRGEVHVYVAVPAEQVAA